MDKTTHKKRYLLFDSGCTSCSSLAQRIEQESADWLEAKSLRDPDMQAYFERAQRPMSWQPTLLEVSDQKVTVSTGLGMRRKLVQGLGLKRTWRIFRFLQSLPLNAAPSGRRQVFRLGGAVLGSLALGLGIQAGHPQAKAGVRTPEAGFNLNVSKLTLEEAQARFQEHKHVQLAQKHFGAIGWDQVHRVEHQDGGKPSYILPLAAPSQTITWLMFNGEEAADGAVIQLSASADKRMTPSLYHPNGTLFGSATFQEGKLIDTYRAPVLPDVNLTCLYLCIWISITDGTVSGNAYDWCYKCVMNHTGVAGAANCLGCAIYAAPLWKACSAQCS